MTSKPGVFGQAYSARHWFPLAEYFFSPIRKLLNCEIWKEMEFNYIFYTK